MFWSRQPSLRQLLERSIVASTRMTASFDRLSGLVSEAVTALGAAAGTPDVAIDNLSDRLEAALRPPAPAADPVQP